MIKVKKIYFIKFSLLFLFIINYSIYSGLFGYVPAAYLQTINEQLDHFGIESHTSESTLNNVESEPENVPHYEFHVDSLPPLPPPDNLAQFVRALYPYEATNSEEISFETGELIRIVDDSSDDGWWTGESKNGKVGHFPSMLVIGLDDDQDEEEDEEDEESSSQTTSVPPSISLSTMAPSILTTIENVNSESDGSSIPTVPPPTFAPPPKPMSLMAPQTVVIIQPTPEIESRPVLGSENLSEDNTTEIENKTQESIFNDANLVNANDQYENMISASMAIAVEEVSSVITQQALDESMRELRRASLTSNHDQDRPVPNGNVVNNDSQEEEDGENEDCK